MKKRGQVAMEFLMTYGWAIIIILLAIAALWLLGVFSPSVPTICQIDAPFTCQDAVVSDNSVLIRLGANQVQSATVNSITVNGQTCPVVSNAQLTSNQITTVRCLGLNLEENEKVTAEIDATYQKIGGSLSHNIAGTVSGQASLGSYVYSGDSGLLAAYDFEDNAQDVTGNNHDGTLTNTDCTVDGKIGKGCSFDGSTSYINFDQVLNTDKSLPISFEAWVNTAVNSGWQTIIGTDGSFAQIAINAQTPHFGQNGVGGWWIISGTNINTDEWHHIVGTFDAAGTAFLYLDGVEVATSSGQNFDVNHGVSLMGRYQLADGEWFQGVIDEAAIYDKVLTPTEVLANYEATK